MIEPDLIHSKRESTYKKHRGFMRLWFAVRNSWNGLICAVFEESAFRQELVLVACLLPLAMLLPFSAIERLLLVGSTLLVLIVELLNSAIEAAIDRISLEHHGLSKRAKDYGSAAVMLALLVCVLTWVVLVYRLLV